MLVLLVSLSFASGQSRPFKHQIDNRSKYESHLTSRDGLPAVSSALKDWGWAVRQSSAANPCGCFYGKKGVWGPVLPFTLVRAYTELSLLTNPN